jgi:hypothetical protein
MEGRSEIGMGRVHSTYERKVPPGVPCANNLVAVYKKPSSIDLGWLFSAEKPLTPVPLIEEDWVRYGFQLSKMW